MTYDKIESVQCVGEDDSYDLEVDSLNHTFYANDISVSNSHAVAYAYDSYQCAWLYTYYPRHWIKACLECDPDLEKTICVVRTLGLDVSKPDVNKSSVSEWNILPNNSCVPPLVSLKGIGLTAANELAHHRPAEGFVDINDFLFKGKVWRWSKFNKKSLTILVRMGAFNPLGCVGPDKVFKNYRHMEAALCDADNFGDIKKGKKTIEECALMAPTEDWTIAEQMTIQKSIMGFFDKSLIVGKFLDTFDEFEILAIDEAEDERPKSRVWAVIEKITQKVAKNGRPFLNVVATGLTEKQYSFRVWDTEASTSDVWKEGAIVIFGLDFSSEYGYNVSRYTKIMKVTK